MSRLPVLLAALFIAACSPDPEVDMGPTEVAARRIVWTDVFKARWSPPRVKWWHTTCPSLPGDTRTAVVSDDGTCYSGLFLPYDCHVAWRGSYSSSAYVHELMHAWQYTRGVWDPGHTNSEWSTVPEVEALLRREGL